MYKRDVPTPNGAKARLSLMSSGRLYQRSGMKERGSSKALSTRSTRWISEGEQMIQQTFQYIGLDIEKERGRERNKGPVTNVGRLSIEEQQS